MSVRAIEPEHFPWFDYARYTFSLGLQHDGYAWLSGHSATQYDPEAGTNVVRGTMAEQTRTAYAKIAAILEGAGLALRDAHRVVEYVTAAGIDHYADVAAVRDELLPERRPAVCTVVVNRLLRPQALVEIEVTAGPGGEPLAGGAAFGAGGFVYLSSITSSDPPGAYDRALEVLASCGLEQNDIAKAVWYTTHSEVTLPEARHASTHVVLKRLQRPGAAVSLDVTATRGRTPLLFCSGRTGGGGDVASQAEDAYRRLFAGLAEVGAGPQNLIKTIEYVTAEGLPRYREVAGVRDRLLRAPFPASTGAVCEGFADPEAQFLVDAVAILD